MLRTAEFGRLFGSGPACAAAGFLLCGIAYFLEYLFGVPRIPLPDLLSQGIFTIAIILTIALAGWGFSSLPLGRRGRGLATTGAFGYMRHPVYAAFLDFFVFGIGFYLKSYGILLAGILLIFVCGRLVDYEEQFLLEKFGNDYAKYRKRVKKFIPLVY